MRRGNLFYPMRKEFHHKAETGEGTRQLDWDSAAIRLMDFGFAFPQARRAAPSADNFSNSSELCSMRQTK